MKTKRAKWLSAEYTNEY